MSQIFERTFECDRCGSQREDRIAPSGKTRTRYSYSHLTLQCRTGGHTWRSTGMRAGPNGPSVVPPVAPTAIDEFEQYRDDLIAFEQYKEKLRKRYS